MGPGAVRVENELKNCPVVNSARSSDPGRALLDVDFIEPYFDETPRHELNRNWQLESSLLD